MFVIFCASDPLAPFDFPFIVTETNDTYVGNAKGNVILALFCPLPNYIITPVFPHFHQPFVDFNAVFSTDALIASIALS